MPDDIFVPSYRYTIAKIDNTAKNNLENLSG
jgi:hypothetical protein